MSILVLNAGSSSLKFALFDDNANEVAISGIIERAGATPVVKVDGDFETPPLEATDLPGQLRYLHAFFGDNANTNPITAIGHRVVHGGERFRESVLLDDDAIKGLHAVARLAPLHNPPAIEVIEAAREAWPSVPHVACFDTAFFATLPPERYLFPVPYEWHTECGIRRYGFHGLSHAYCVNRAAELLERPLEELKIVTCHLGAGCSMAATVGGKAVATTMGLTPLDGLIMATRPGSLDPGVVLEAQRRGGFSPDELDRILNRESGLLGISGESADYRELELLAEEGHERARLALMMFENRIAETVASLAVAIDGLDVLVFTAGIGENSAALRSRVCRRLRWFGVRIDPSANDTVVGDSVISTAKSLSAVVVVQTREDLVIANEANRIRHS